MDAKASSPRHKAAQFDTKAEQLDIIEEAMARARLKRMRARPVRRPPPKIGHDVRKLLRKHDKGKAASIRKLKQDWEQLVGTQIARFCQPEKLTGNKEGRTLVLRVHPAAAPRIQHESEAIRQRISVAAGGTVTRLKLVQGLPVAAKTKGRKPARTLSFEERKALEEDTASISDPKLRAALQALGKAILTDKA